MPRLILRPGKADERVHELGPGTYTIGRTQQNDVYVLHESLSRQHARLVIDHGGATIEDLGSKNGTFVDGVRVAARRALGAAHYLKCGDVVFAWVGTAEAALRPTRSVATGADPAAPTLEQLLEDHAATSDTVLAGDAEDRAGARLRVLLKVGELLSSPAPLDAVLARILGLAFQILAVDRGTLLLAGPDGPVARIARTREGPVAPDQAGYSRHVVAQAIERREAVLFDDARADPRLATSGSVMQQSICASMCAPLVTRSGEVLGAIYLDNQSLPHPFDENDLTFFAAFASQAAIALDNARLAQQLADEAVARAHLLRFFPPTAIEAVLQQGLAIVETEATLLFCDLSDYTALSSRHPPREVIELLNAYLPVMAEIVFRHEGTLEKYVGDALLAAWGAPLRHPEDAQRAVAAAIDMQRAMATVRARWPKEPLHVHVGIASGPVAAGNVGTGAFLQYATIGEVTSRAARICGAAGAGEIVVDEATRQRLPASWPLTALPPVALKGCGPVALHRVDWSA